VSDLDPFPFRADVPKHVQIADVLRERITSGKLRPRLPIGSEPTLMSEFGVARDTVRKAIRLLRDEGYLVTQPGMGSFVTDPHEWPKAE
jgi:DNA-binding GntR family transcriptional regulator